MSEECTHVSAPNQSEGLDLTRAGCFFPSFIFMALYSVHIVSVYIVTVMSVQCIILLNMNHAGGKTFQAILDMCTGPV